MVEHPGEATYNSGLDKKDPSRVSIGIITAITIETFAVEQILDDAVAVQIPGDHHPYLVGTLPSLSPAQPHVVAVAQQTSDGTRDAAWLCGHMPRTFQDLRAIAMCGVAGGVPSTAPDKNVALGDIVVATQIVDYRHERLIDGSNVIRGTVRPPGSIWMNADHQVEADEMRGSPPWLPALEAACRKDPFRRPVATGRPRAHRGPVGSADLLVRDAVFRDGLARDHRILAFEMEGAGIAIGSHLGDRSWFMVRGVADHGDNNTKDDIWHPYAALAAASYLRSVLARCSPFVPPPEPEKTPAQEKPPAPEKPRGLDPLNAMTDALQKLRVMRDESQRRAVLDQFPTPIRVQIPENSLGRLHIIETIRALERYPDGLDVLLGALGRTLGSQSPDFIEAEGVLRANWTGQ